MVPKTFSVIQRASNRGSISGSCQSCWSFRSYDGVDFSGFLKVWGQAFLVGLGGEAVDGLC